ncbi:hypothetical protein PTTG_07573 [Puccinia triticina 1-1 BBBD Race 1]|uniref:Uncharacterized protein n=1 Tax=Puccinia triticina (isolate 1-1 / race 1 (BBBD)) TaxID=630390 RepID=A0A180GP29_PUCT1|nr:hypothetical protein PTTG_07573 [Puccinia triticina 1-1 BBBD Race 1]
MAQIPLRASPTLLQLHDLQPILVARKAFLTSSRAAERASEVRGCWSRLPLAASFGSFGIQPSKLLNPQFGPLVVMVQFFKHTLHINNLNIMPPKRVQVLVNPLPLGSMTPTRPSLPRNQPDPNTTPTASAPITSATQNLPDLNAKPTASAPPPDLVIPENAKKAPN